MLRFQLILFALLQLTVVVSQDNNRNPYESPYLKLVENVQQYGRNPPATNKDANQPRLVKPPLVEQNSIQQRPNLASDQQQQQQQTNVYGLKPNEQILKSKESRIFNFGNEPDSISSIQTAQLIGTQNQPTNNLILNPSVPLLDIDNHQPKDNQNAIQPNVQIPQNRKTNQIDPELFESIPDQYKPQYNQATNTGELEPFGTQINSQPNRQIPTKYAANGQSGQPNYQGGNYVGIQLSSKLIEVQPVKDPVKLVRSNQVSMLRKVIPPPIVRQQLYGGQNSVQKFATPSTIYQQYYNGDGQQPSIQPVETVTQTLSTHQQSYEGQNYGQTANQSPSNQQTYNVPTPPAKIYHFGGKQFETVRNSQVEQPQPQYYSNQSAVETPISLPYNGQTDRITSSVNGNFNSQQQFGQVAKGKEDLPVVLDDEEIPVKQADSQPQSVSQISPLIDESQYYRPPTVRPYRTSEPLWYSGSPPIYRPTATQFAYQPEITRITVGPQRQITVRFAYPPVIPSNRFAADLYNAEYANSLPLLRRYKITRQQR